MDLVLGLEGMREVAGSAGRRLEPAESRPQGDTYCLAKALQCLPHAQGGAGFMGKELVSPIPKQTGADRVDLLHQIKLLEVTREAVCGII